MLTSIWFKFFCSNWWNNLFAFKWSVLRFYLFFSLRLLFSFCSNRLETILKILPIDRSQWPVEASNLKTIAKNKRLFRRNFEWWQYKLKLSSIFMCPISINKWKKGLKLIEPASSRSLSIVSKSLSPTTILSLTRESWHVEQKSQDLTNSKRSVRYSSNNSPSSCKYAKRNH